MAGSAVLDVKILVDAAKAAAGLGDVAGKFESFGKKLGNAVIGAVAIKGIGELVKTVVMSASQLEQAMGGTDKVFGSSAGAIHDWAADTSDSVRLPAAAVERFATLIKTQLDSTGQPMSKIVENTKALVQAGADLSAVTGADLSTSIAAVKSALAGEYDPIQNLGVAMTAATVSTKALEIAHGDLAEASTPAIMQQARVAEILEKAAFATGAAAEETNSFQARLDALKEQAGNLAGAIGGPMLDSLGQLVEGFTEGAGAATTIGAGLGTMLGGLLSLPAPIQAIGAGLLVLVAVSAKWGGAVIAAIGSVVTSMGTATSSAAGFKAAMAGIMAPLAGGALLLGVGALILAVAHAIGAVSAAAESGTSALDGYVAALVESGGASTDATAKAHDAAVLSSEAFKAMIADGMGAADAVRILNGTQEQWQGLLSNNDASVRMLSGSTNTLVNGFIDANGQAGKLAAAQIEGARAQQQQAAAIDSATAAQDANNAANATAAGILDALPGAYTALGEAMKGAVQQTELQTALDGTKEAANEAGRAMEFINAQIDQFTGRSASLDDATVDWNSKLRIDDETTNSVATYVSTVDGGAAALNEFNTAQLGQSKAGEEAYAQLRGLKTGYDELNAAAYEAALKTGGTEAAFSALASTSKSSRDSFIGWAQPLADAGVDVQALADKLGILDLTTLSPKFMEVIGKDADAQAMLARFQAAKIDPKTVTITADDRATPAIESAITYVDQLTGVTHTIPLTADAADANAVLAAIIADIAVQHPELAIGATPGPANAALEGVLGAINGATGTATIAANPAPANGTLGATKGAIDGTTGTLAIAGNPAPANATVNQTTGAVQANGAAILRIIGNSAPARQAVDAFVSDTNARTASVTVNANTAPFYAAYNALPTSREVTITTRNVQVNVPAAPTPPAAVAFAAPTLAKTSSATASGSSSGRSVNITIQGAVDPDSTARQIQRLLTGRGRRVGGIVI